MLFCSDFILFYFCCHPTLLVSLYITIINVYVRLSHIIKIACLLTYLLIWRSCKRIRDFLFLASKMRVITPFDFQHDESLIIHVLCEWIYDEIAKKTADYRLLTAAWLEKNARWRSTSAGSALARRKLLIDRQARVKRAQNSINRRSKTRRRWPLSP